ncbi:hypothetical protein IQ249_24290 [Lusitaniella coriacea LEGE 07157]|uniref:Uncharacterized protein n=1 Tax=Lusitaniella coriacea LEGE 07157 TaxID=945747 RepID=A0A8J7E259_9CYAN|nr:hypothetical protein [Lusitaniella coriacea]MBE9119013.1 hypothetical protein [Lusitaniella coriacea LEGE 07157]
MRNKLSIICTGVAISLLAGTMGIKTAQAAPTNQCLSLTGDADRTGTIKSIVGSQVLLKLDGVANERDRFVWVGSSKGQIGTLNLIEGTRVCLSENPEMDRYAIVGFLPFVDPVVARESTSRVSQLDFGSTTPQTTIPPRQVTPTPRPTSVSPAAPIPGLW